jgi:hypothetical protein
VEDEGPHLDALARRHCELIRFDGSRLTVEPTGSQMAARKIASPARKPLAAIKPASRLRGAAPATMLPSPKREAAARRMTLDALGVKVKFQQ